MIRVRIQHIQSAARFRPTNIVLLFGALLFLGAAIFHIRAGYALETKIPDTKTVIIAAMAPDLCKALLTPTRPPQDYNAGAVRLKTQPIDQRAAAQAAASLFLGVQFALGLTEHRAPQANPAKTIALSGGGRNALSVAAYRRCKNQEQLQASLR